MNKRKINNQGISPLLAVAIMVAITVVLAGTLYLMVLTPSNRPCCPPPETPDGGALLDARAISENSGIIVFDDFTSPVDCSELRIFVRINNISVGEIYWPNYNNTEPIWHKGPAGASAIYHDIYGTSLIGSGDSLTLTGLRPGNSYSFEFMYTFTNELIPMSGIEPVFVTLEI